MTTPASLPPAAPLRETFHHGDLRHALLVAAEAQLREVGPENFSLREAARAVGVSPAAAYRHFTDKGALLAVLASQGFVRLATAMEEAMAAAGKDPVARLRANGRAYVEFARREPALFGLMFGPYGAGGPHPVSGTGPKTGLSAFQLLQRALDDLVLDGLMSAKRRAGAESLLWSSVHGLATLANAGVSREPAVTAFDNMFPLVRKALGLGKE